MWEIPEAGTATGSEEAVVEWMLERLLDPLAARMRLEHVRRHPEEETADELRLRDGRVVERRGAPVRDADGVLRGRAWFFTDVTERAQMEQAHANALRRQRVTEALARALTEDEAARTVAREGATSLGAAACWIGLVADDGPYLERLASSGYEPELDAAYARLPLTIENPVVEVVRRKHPLWLRSAAEVAEAYPAIAPDYRRSGFQAMAVLPLTVGRRALGAIALNFAEPRRFDEEHRRLLAAFAAESAQSIERTRLYRQLAERAQAVSVLDHVGDGVFKADADGRITFWNRGAEVLTGIEAAEAIGKLVPQVFGGFEAIVDRLQTTDVPVAVGRREALPVEINGRERWLAISGVVTGDGIVYAFRDVTDSEALEKTRRDLVATVSHELRTPLAAVFGAAKTLRERTLDAEQTSALLAIVERETERLGRILDELLVAARLDARRVELDLGRCDLVALAREVVETERGRLPRGTFLIVEERGTVPEARCDAEKTRQVLVNLLDNAIKYSPDGGRITVSLERAGDRVLVSVTDQGLGIPYEHQERVFEKFFRLDPQLSRGVGGTGLGLYISREFVEQMNGRISLESRPGSGTTFRVELPAAH